MIEEEEKERRKKKCGQRIMQRDINKHKDRLQTNEENGNREKQMKY